MNDPQNLGLGELGKRMQAMSDPVPDSRLRPYQSAQPSTISASNGHTGPLLEPYEDLRNAPPPSPVPYPQQPVLTPAPTQGSSVNLAAPSREPVSPWEPVPTPASAPAPVPPPQQQSLPPGPQPAVPVAADTHATFQIDVPVQPTISGQTATAGDLRVQVLSPANATLQAIDWTTVDSDFNSGWRIDISGGNGEYIVVLGSAAASGDEIFADGFD